MDRFSSTSCSTTDLETLWRTLPPEAARLTFAVADTAQRWRDARANRAKAAAASNRKRALQPAVAELAARVANTSVMQRKKVAETVLDFIGRKGLPECGLPRMPCLETVRRAMRRK